MSGRDDMEALLPFYLNGSLEGEDLRAVEDWLASDAAAMAALAEAEMEYAENAAANEAIRPPADALSRFSKALEHEAGADRQAAVSWLGDAWRRLAGLPAGLAWATAAIAVAVVLLQAVTGNVLDDRGYEIAGTPDEMTKRPFALVVFKPDARMADVGAFLSDNGAAILEGPTAGGVFRIALPAETAADYDRLLTLLAAQSFAENVTPGRRPANGG